MSLVFIRSIIVGLRAPLTKFTMLPRIYLRPLITRGVALFSAPCPQARERTKNPTHAHILARVFCSHTCTRIYTRRSTFNRVCKIIGTEIILLYVAILHLVPLTSTQILSLKVFSPTLFEISLFIAFC